MWGSFDSRHPVHLRKWLWSQKEPEPFIYLVERATGSPRICFANPCSAAGRWPLRAALENAHAFPQLRTLPDSIPVAQRVNENGSDSKKEIRAVYLSCGAGDGNRTRVISLEGWGSTIELRPQEYGRDDRIRTCDILLPKQARYQTAPRPEGVEQLRSKPCVSQSEGNYRVDSPPVQATIP